MKRSRILGRVIRKRFLRVLTESGYTKAFRDNGGKVFWGDEVWAHLSEVSGSEIATFVKRYIKDPVESIAVRERELLDLGLRYKSGADGDTIEVTIGEHRWIVPRPRRDEAVAVPEEGES